MPAAIEIYTRPGCGYCAAAKSLLTRKNVAFTEFDAGIDPSYRQKMYDLVCEGSTFPQIFIDKVHIGGCEDLYALDRGGKLDAMLAGEKGHLVSTPFKAALIQMRTRLEPADSLEQASALIRQAVAEGAQYVQTPEVSNMIQKNRAGLFERLKPEDEDLSLRAYRALAKELNIYLHIGSLAVLATPDRAANRSFLIGPDGTLLASYDKMHMFDIDLGTGESYHESANYQPGETAVMTDLPWGKLGLTICYDMRFPALYRALAEAGADFISVPSAFTRPTGEAHWHVLLRSRAIENGCFVLAAAQAGTHESGRISYGHSLIVAPWGEILAEGDAEIGIVSATIDPAKVVEARRKVPSLQHGRRFSMGGAAEAAGRLHLVKGSA